MNAPFPVPESLPRHKFTHDEVLDLTAQGLVPKRAVLLDGEIYDMPEDGFNHISVTMRLARHVMVTLDPAAYFVGVQTSLRLSKHNVPSPDIYVLAGALPNSDVPPDQILLVIEVADSSLRDDLAASASRYARHGVRDFWVVDVNAREIHIHRTPKDGAYPPPVRVSADAAASPLLIPGLAIVLDHVAPAA